MGAIIKRQFLDRSANSAEDMLERVQEVLLQADKARYFPPNVAWIRHKGRAVTSSGHKAAQLSSSRQRPAVGTLFTGGDVVCW
jgi:hypothetical protein